VTLNVVGSGPVVHPRSLLSSLHRKRAAMTVGRGRRPCGILVAEVSSGGIAMCDTLCALPSWTACGHTLIGKNSDRDSNEPHVILYVPGKSHESGSRLRCTYIEVPQVSRTNEVLLFKPDWIWGAEMGVNEYGVAIGNEAVFTRAKREKAGLIGMDLLRLALERADSAEMALEIITDLLAEYGQGGNCGYSKDFRYDNSYLIADPIKAFVLETAGRSYAAVPVSRAAAISNRLSIRGEHTLRRGVEDGVDFAKTFTEPVFSHFAQGAGRRGQCLTALESRPVSVPQMIDVLRSHRSKQEGREFTRSDVGSVCMHAGGPIGDHTTGSFVAVLRRDAPITVWATGASTPCLSAFKPIFFGSGSPVHASDEEGRAYWLERERLHRAVLAGLVDVAALRTQRDALEAAWHEEEARLFSEGDPDPAMLHEFSARAAAQEQEMVSAFSRDEWSRMPGWGYFARYWRKKNASLTC
jgi:secernin